MVAIFRRLLVTRVVLSIVVSLASLINNSPVPAQGIRRGQLPPKKLAAKSRSELALKADELFWQTFHTGEYQNIQRALNVLTAAYLQTPGDAKTAAHIGFMHNWHVAERNRLESVPATITDDIILSRRYFQEAVRLDPSDARYLGFLADSILLEGNLHKDDRLTREGYVLLHNAIKAWPEFNLFSGGFVMSRLPSDAPWFREGLEWQWRNIDECNGEKIDRANPDLSKYMVKETKEGNKRVCWNSWIAPHNFEGFFLNMGDMLVKSGDWRTAQKIYANAKLSHEYATWKYQSVLEDRIRQAQSNVAVFNEKKETPKAGIMLNSEFACMACHRQ